MGKYYIGLDGGSTYLKAALIGNGQVVDTMVRSTGIDNNGTAQLLARELCNRNAVTPSEVGYIMATGYSRKVLEMAIFPRSPPMPTACALPLRRNTSQV